MIIYNNGGETLDRYTVFPFVRGKCRTEYLALSENGLGFSMWGSMPVNFRHSDCRHLGKRVQFDNLSKELQAHIIRRIAE